MIHPAFEGSESEVAAYHEDNLRNCQGALIFYGSVGEPWLRGKLRELQKSAAFRETCASPPTGICLIAPRTPIKERFRTHQATLIPQWDGVSPDELQSFVARVTGTEEPPAGDATDSSKLIPFPGLRPFEADEEHLFFGREKEIADLVRRLGSHRFLSVIGTSGSGKSSLVRSGLIPSLHSGVMVKTGSAGAWPSCVRERTRSAIWRRRSTIRTCSARAARSRAPVESCSKRRCAEARSASWTRFARRASLRTRTC